VGDLKDWTPPACNAIVAAEWLENTESVPTEGFCRGGCGTEPSTASGEGSPFAKRVLATVIKTRALEMVNYVPAVRVGETRKGKEIERKEKK